MIKIINLFFTYIKTVAMLIFLQILAEFAVPDNSYRKYIDITMGFIIILTLLTPVTKIIKTENIKIDKEINMPVFKEMSMPDKNIQKKLTEEVYKNDLENTANEKLKSLGAEFLETDIEFSVNNENYGEVTGINIIVSGSTDNEKNIKEEISSLFGVNENDINITFSEE